MVFLIISQNSQENTSFSVSVLIKMTLYCEICETFKKNFSTEHTQVTSSQPNKRLILPSETDLVCPTYKICNSNDLQL